MTESTVGASIVLAAYNEGPSLRVALERVVCVMNASGADWELVVVDDGSSDDTASVLRDFSASCPGALNVRTHSVNRGLVAAMRTGAEAALKETVVFLDADLSYDPSIVERLLAAKAESGAAVVVASPYMKGGQVANVPLDRLIASRGANWLLSRCAGGRMHTFTGMVRAYDRTVLLDLMARPEIGEFNTWAVAACIEADRRVVEIPAALVWPPARYAAPSRISLRKLIDRAKLVVKTAAYLVAACRRSKLLKTGTLVLSGESEGPFSLRT